MLAPPKKNKKGIKWQDMKPLGFVCIVSHHNHTYDKAEGFTELKKKDKEEWFKFLTAYKNTIREMNLLDSAVANYKITIK